MRLVCALATAALALPAARSEAQILTVTGPSSSKTLSAQAFAALPRQSIVANLKGREVTFEGASVTTLAALVGAPSGEALRGPALATVVIVTASDGYRVALSLAETDPAIRSEAAIVADRADGKPLDAYDGPLRLVTAGDKRPARWARDVRGIEVRPLP